MTQGPVALAAVYPLTNLNTHVEVVQFPLGIQHLEVGQGHPVPIILLTFLET